jgi:Zn-finger protein
MDDFTRKCIGLHINSILEKFSYENRKKENPEDCPCYAASPCHDITDLNCFLCYCPWYENKKAEGGCEIGNPLGKGKWFEREGHPISNKVWDCSNCEYPHKIEVAEKFLITAFVKK